MNTFIKYKGFAHQTGYGELGNSSILNHTLSDSTTLAPMFDGAMNHESEYYRRILLTDHKFMGDAMGWHGGTCNDMFSQSHPTLGGAYESQIQVGSYWLCSLNQLTRVDGSGNVQQAFPNRGTVHPFPQVIHETADYIYTMSASSDINATTNDVQGVRKADGIVVYNSPNNGGGHGSVPSLLGATATHIWVMTTYYSYVKIYRINLIAHTTTTVSTVNYGYTSANTKAGNTAIIHDVANTTWSFHTAEQKSTTELQLRYFTVNYSTDTVTNEVLSPTDPSSFSIETNFPGATNYRYGYLNPFYVGTDHILVCQEHCNNSIMNGNFVVFKKDTAAANSPITAVSRTDMPEQGNRGYHPLTDDNTVMLSTGQTDSRIWNFNGVTEAYEMVESIPAVREVGKDSIGRRWLYDQDENITLVSLALPSQITIIPALTSYTYDGIDINTTVTVGSYNVAGALIESNVTLTISGPGMTFADATNTFVMTTSASSTTEVPVVITGGGLTRILAAMTLV
jgi:hypothetical protein